MNKHSGRNGEKLALIAANSQFVACKELNSIALFFLELFAITGGDYQKNGSLPEKTVPSRLVIDWAAKLLQMKEVEDMMSVVVEYPQVVRLMKVTGDNAVMMSVRLFGHLQRDIKSQELFDPL
jgi:hypothetical protein